MPSKQIAAFLACVLSAGLPTARCAGRLRGEASRFLRSNAESPVDWMPWGPEAFARAKAEQKPIFVFVGSYTSELARAMCDQTFANTVTSKWLNEQFVCVMVDRQERPDLGNLYEAYVVRVKQLSGWPLNIWLTPDLLPFEGAAYLGPSEDWGRPGFLNEANAAKTAWVTNRAGCLSRAAEAVSHLAPDVSPPPGSWGPEKSRARLSAAATAWMATYDQADGGFSTPPKNPEPELLRFLLIQDAPDREAALMTLRALSTSAVRDPLDGGFFRYAVDSKWNLPYPQKTLADQARMALAFLDAAHGADKAAFEQCARGALDFALSSLGKPDGTFASAVDATGDSFAGYYAWTEREIDEALGSDSAAFKKAHGVKPGGNIPQDDDPSGVYANKNLLRSSNDTDAGLAADAARLLALRDQRPSPSVDDRATAGDHGLILSALARAGKQLGEPRYVAAATRTLKAVEASFIVSPSGDLRRLVGASWPAAPVDYAALALGCRDYAGAFGDISANVLAGKLLARLDLQFYDHASRQYFSAPSRAGPGIFVRTLVEGDVPAPESLALLSGETAEMTKDLSGAQLDSLDEGNPQAPGDQLLALAKTTAK
jgi:uncharacterized protein YyaL (SSP411 family)